jgi:ATP-dependent DNA helicase RecG
MITPEELLVLLNDLESDKVERTVSVNNTDKFSEAVCAFANNFSGDRKPGFLVVGANDNGDIAGIEITDNLLLRLANLRSDGNILPLPLITVEKIVLAGGNVAVVQVNPSDFPPVRYKGRAYIRVGPRRGIATEQEERVLSERRSSLSGSFDTSVVTDATLNELSLSIFQSYRQLVIAPEIIAENHRSPEEQLASLRFYHLGRQLATVSGILLFAINPRYFLPGAYIQYLRFPNQTMTDLPDDQREISGDLQSVLRELDLQVNVNIQNTLQSKTALSETLSSTYPVVAVRELLLNAVMHRDYQSFTPIKFSWFQDRIEILSPGGLYGEVTEQNLTTINSYRNPIIAETMKNLGYVNRFGYGIQRAEAELKRNGNPPVEFDIDTHYFLCIIRRSIG